MSLQTIPQILTEIVQTALAEAELTGILQEDEPVVATKNAKFGDFQANHAFRIARQIRTNPRQVASTVQAAIPDHPAVKKVDVAGPGFLNFHLEEDWLVTQLQAQLGDQHGGIAQTGAGKTVVIDYSSPNVAKRMHIGHMRSTIIGHALDRIYRSLGWQVIADNHIGDWGTQFGKLIVAWHHERDDEGFARDPIGELERLYVQFSQNATAEQQEKARQETAKLQAGDPENRQLWQRFIKVSLQEFDRVYERLGITFDETLGESAYNDALPGVVAELVDRKLAVSSDGATVVRFPDDMPIKRLAGTVLVIRKKDGAFLYGTTDIATLEHRQETWQPAQIVYVTDMRQQLHFQQVFHVWNQLREQRQLWTQEPELIHVYFGMLKLPEGAMSSRKGNVIRLVDLLDEAARRARAVVDEKSPHLSEEERAFIAEKVGVAAIRYSDLSQNPQSDVKFSWDRMLSLEGNTAPFLMYGYARACGILRKAEEHAIHWADLQISDATERELCLKLLAFPQVVAASQKQSKPNMLCDHLYDLAKVFNRFHFSNPVLKAPTSELRASRLAMVSAVTKVLGRGLDLLGITALQRM